MVEGATPTVVFACFSKTTEQVQLHAEGAVSNIADAEQTLVVWR